MQHGSEIANMDSTKQPATRAKVFVESNSGGLTGGVEVGRFFGRVAPERFIHGMRKIRRRNCLTAAGLTREPRAGESCRLFLNTLALYDPHIPVNRNIREFVDLFTRGWPVDFKLIDLGRVTDPQYYARIMGR